MDKPWIAKNKEWREKLQKFVSKVTDKELQLVIYKEGWTIAVMLGHLAFWDLRRAALVKYWKQNGVKQSDIVGLEMNTINDALVPLFLAMPPRKVAELAVKAAEAVDKELATLPEDFLPQIEGLGEPTYINRGIHRQIHLDEIEMLLKSKKKK